MDASPSQMTLLAAGIKDGTKIQMLGSTTEEIGGMHAVENEQKRRDQIMRERALKAPTKVHAILARMIIAIHAVGLC
jgi:hypothetical protein